MSEDHTLNKSKNIQSMTNDKKLHDLTSSWFQRTLLHNYSYNFSYMGRPIIQYPQDMVLMQELILNLKPDLVIETGIAHGGSIVMSAATLALVDYCEAVENGTVLDPKNPKRKVLGIDIDIREHNKKEILSNPMISRIDMIEGSSVSEEIIEEVYKYAKPHKNILIFLDSNHTHQHVLDELRAYAPLVSKDSYCVVYDTIVEDLPEDQFPNRPWGKGDNPKTALFQYLDEIKNSPINGVDGEILNFTVDKEIENKIQITVAPDGFLKRI